MAKPEDIRFTDQLPKTRSGKIMRRLLRELATHGEVKGRHYDARRFQRDFKVERRRVRSAGIGQQ
jgi:hypothetical protein